MTVLSIFELGRISWVRAGGLSFLIFINKNVFREKLPFPLKGFVSAMRAFETILMLCYTAKHVSYGMSMSHSNNSSALSFKLLQCSVSLAVIHSNVAWSLRKNLVWHLTKQNTYNFKDRLCSHPFMTNIVKHNQNISNIFITWTIFQQLQIIYATVEQKSTIVLLVQNMTAEVEVLPTFKT